jgi:hypothetical protein
LEAVISKPDRVAERGRRLASSIVHALHVRQSGKRTFGKKFFKASVIISQKEGYIPVASRYVRNLQVRSFSWNRWMQDVT